MGAGASLKIWAGACPPEVDGIEPITISAKLGAIDLDLAATGGFSMKLVVAFDNPTT